VRCAKCGADNREGRKFCAQCGSPLAAKCPSCGASNESGERFCGECGAALAATAAPTPKKSEEPQIRVAHASAPENLDGERKTVTALFADIKGSMELIEDLDPEEARAIVDPALKLMMEAVQRYGGYVAQSTGDGIFALFGAPVAHEDHPQRALYAALRMQEELKRYSDGIRSEGLPLQVRIGVNTGEVVVRTVQTGEGHTEYVPIGHATSLAARMQALAPIGSIAATEPVRRLCEGYFTFKTLGPTKVKGVRDPVEVYEVTGPGALHSHFELSARRGLTRFVGRERELDQLRRALELALDGQGQVAGVVAEAGTGKSRLFYEFKGTIPATCKVLEAYSVSHGKASPWLPVLQLLRGYFDIQDSDDPRVRRKKIRAALSALDPALGDTLPYLFELLGIPDDGDPLAQMDPQIKRQRTFDALKRILLRESLRQPIVVIFEDLHWIDDQTQALLDLLADSIANARILLLANYRPEYHHGWTNKSYYLQLRLDPLGGAEGTAMLVVLLGESVELNPIKRLIAERTGGNPFFIEEIVQTLFDEGTLVRDGAVKVTRSLSQLKLPPTVQGMLAARIDRLSSSQKALLQTLAVLGRESSLGLLKQVASDSDTQLGLTLAQLRASEFIYEQPVAGDVEYVFKHALTQEVAYNSLLIDRRRVLHERAGQALESTFAGQLEEHLADLAHHYSRGGNREKAIQYLQLAAQQAAQRSASSVAIEQLTNALRTLKTLPETAQRDQQELILQMMLGPLLSATKGNASLEVEQIYLRARELAQQLNATSQQLPSLFNLRSVYLVRGELLRAHELSQQLVSLAETENDTEHLLEARVALGNTFFFQGALRQAHTQFQEAVGIYDQKRHRSHAFVYGLDPGVLCLGRITWTRFALGYLDLTLEKTRALLALAREVSHPLSLVFALMAASEVYLLRRETDPANELSEWAMRVAEEQGLANYLGQATIYSGATLAQKGQTSEGISRIRQGLAACRATGAVLFRPFYLRFLADADLRAEQLTEGLAVVDEALSLVSQTQERYPEAELWRLKGELAHQTGLECLPEAENCLRKAIAVAHSQEAKFWELRATTSLARLLRDTNRRDEARAMLAEIYDWFTEGFDTADLKDAKALLEELRR
jgi:class 3 adenylate cyclase/predicted ATPase